MNSMYFPVVGRIFIAALFVTQGVYKFMGLAGTAAFIGSVGLPMPMVLAVLAATLEVIAGVMLIVGYKTKIAAWALALFTIVATAIFHNQLGDQMQQLMALKNLSILGGLMYVIAFGSGSMSMGNRSVSGSTM